MGVAAFRDMGYGRRFFKRAAEIAIAEYRCRPQPVAGGLLGATELLGGTLMCVLVGRVAFRRSRTAQVARLRAAVPVIVTMVLAIAGSSPEEATFLQQLGFATALVSLCLLALFRSYERMAASR